MKNTIRRVFLIFLLSSVGFAHRPRQPHNPCPQVIPNSHGYTMDLVNGDRVCCMCNAGTFMAQACEIGKPSTTVCQPCPFDEHDSQQQYYRDEGPHLHTTCKKSIALCRGHFIRIRGSPENAARCEKSYRVILHPEKRHQQHS